MIASYDEIKEIAKKVFGIDTIFPYQWLVISNILDIEAKNEDGTPRSSQFNPAFYLSAGITIK